MSFPTEENKVQTDADFSQQVCQVTERFANAIKSEREKEQDKIARDKLYVANRVQALVKAVQEAIILQQDYITDLITGKKTDGNGRKIYTTNILIRASKGDNRTEIHSLFQDALRKSGYICGLPYVECKSTTDVVGTVVYTITVRLV